MSDLRLFDCPPRADRGTPVTDHGEHGEGSTSSDERGAAFSALRPGAIASAEEAQERRNGHQASDHHEEATKAEGTVEICGEKAFPPHISTVSGPFPRELGPAAYCGLAGEIVQAIEPYTEAHPVAVLVSTLVMFGNAIGRGPYFMAGDAAHATNLYACIAGETSSGRKGTSGEGPRRLFIQAEPAWKRCVNSGLVSGEGVIYHVRDPRTERREAKTADEKRHADESGMIEQTVDRGVDDKRLMVLVPEFAQVLAVIARKDNTLSPVLREFWDRGDAQTMAKNSPVRATGALVSV